MSEAISAVAAPPDPPAPGGVEAFVEEQWTRLYQTAYLMTRHGAEAEDAVQTTLAIVVERWSSIRQQDDPGGYAYRVLVRHIWRRSSRLRLEVPRAENPQLRVVPDATTRIDDRAVLVPALRTLPPRMRAAIVLRFFADMSEQQAADALGVSVGTVKSQTSKGLTRLRAALASRGGSNDTPR